MGDHTRAWIDEPAQHPGAWITRTEFIDGIRVTWKRTRCSDGKAGRCKCGSDDPALWHGPYAYVHCPTPGGRSTTQISAGREICDGMVRALARAIGRGQEAAPVRARWRRKLTETWYTADGVAERQLTMVPPRRRS